MENEYFEKNTDLMLLGYKFFSCGKDQCSIYYKGYVYSLKTPIEKWLNELAGKLSDKEDLFSAFLFAELKRISGLFSIVIKKGNNYYIAGDRIRSLPVFYGFHNNNLFITNNLDEYQKQNSLLITDNDKIEEYMSSGFVLGNGTIYKNVYGIQAGELVTIKDNKIKSERYFRFKPAAKRLHYENVKEFTSALDQIMLLVFSRMIEQTPKVNRWIIPLSGGHDSRMIANCLYRLGIRNVVCYSYGRHNNEQSEISRQVANALDFEWHFVEYSEQKWKALHENGIIDKFISYTFNGVSTPHLQDFLAIHELSQKKILKKGDILLPGHTGDFIAGCNFGESDAQCENKNMAIERAVMAHTKIFNLSSLPVTTFGRIYDNAKIAPMYFQEYINWQELRAKFTVNSLRTYDFFGFETRLPYWDKEIIDFWLSVADNQRMGRKIYLEAEKHGILVNKLLSIPFFGKNDRGSENNIIENITRKLLPDYLKTMILRITKRKVKYNAGLNQIYALKASTVKELLDPVTDFPAQTIPYFHNFLNRLTHQVDYHQLSTFYAIRKQLDRYKNA